MTDCEYTPVEIIPPEYPEFECDCDSIEAAINAKQDKLTAGRNITIENNVISASGGGGGTDYQAGVNIDITGDVISAPNVYSKTEVDEALEGYVTVQEMNTELARKQDVLNKADILDILGYEEATMTITDINEQLTTKTVLVKKEV